MKTLENNMCPNLSSNRRSIAKFNNIGIILTQKLSRYLEYPFYVFFSCGNNGKQNFRMEDHMRSLKTDHVKFHDDEI